MKANDKNRFKNLFKTLRVIQKLKHAPLEELKHKYHAIELV
jgi:hypothetical protein